MTPGVLKVEGKIEEDDVDVGSLLGEFRDRSGPPGVLDFQSCSLAALADHLPPFALTSILPL